MDAMIEKVAGHRWYILAKPEENEAEIARRDPDGRGWIAPLASFMLGCTEEDDEGETVATLDDEAGLILYATACIPEFLRLLLWIAQELQSPPNDQMFREQLGNRVDWLLDRLTHRSPLREGNHSFVKYEPQ